MAFAAYKPRHDGKDFSFKGRDDEAGILGTLDPGEDQPVANADTLAQIELEGWAYLGREPSARLYLTDDEYRIHDILSNETYHAEMEKAGQLSATVLILLIFCLTCLVAASFGSFGRWPFVVFLGAIGLYWLLDGLMGLRELESGFIIEIGVIASFILLHLHGSLH